MELWAPPTYSRHLPALPAAFALLVRELQLPADVAALATCLQTTYPRRLRAARPLQECSKLPGPEYPVNPVGSFSRTFIETEPKCTYLKRQDTEISGGEGVGCVGRELASEWRFRDLALLTVSAEMILEDLPTPLRLWA